VHPCNTALCPVKHRMEYICYQNISETDTRESVSIMNWWQIVSAIPNCQYQSLKFEQECLLIVHIYLPFQLSEGITNVLHKSPIALTGLRNYGLCYNKTWYSDICQYVYFLQKDHFEHFSSVLNC
jgi:hypothetical protein